MGGEKTSGKNTGAVKREDAVHSFNLLKDKLDQQANIQQIAKGLEF